MIRRARRDDASSLAAVGIETWQSTYIREGVNAFFADYALSHFTKENVEAILANESKSIWVSENGIGIDGYLVMSFGSPAPAPGCSDLEIETLYVQPRHQGNGAGARLLEVASKFAMDTGHSNVWLTVNAENERAITFYQAKGFVRAGVAYFQIGEERYLNIVLRLDFKRYERRNLL